MVEKLISIYIDYLKNNQTQSVPHHVREKKKVPTRPHLAKAPTIASEEGFTNFTALVSRNMPRYNKMMTNKICFAALFTEQQRLPPT